VEARTEAECREHVAEVLELIAEVSHHTGEVHAGGVRSGGA
jgi:hypothetical protein